MIEVTRRVVVPGDRSGRLPRPAALSQRAPPRSTPRSLPASFSKRLLDDRARARAHAGRPAVRPRTVDLDLLVVEGRGARRAGSDACRTRGCTNGASRSSRLSSSSRRSSSRATARCRSFLEQLQLWTRMSHLDELDEFEAKLELESEAGVHRRLRPVPLLHPDAGRHVPVQPARPQGGASGELPVLPYPDGGRVGLGQEPSDADDPARRGATPRVTSRSRSSAAKATSRS